MHRLRLVSLVLASGLTALPAWPQLKVPRAPAAPALTATPAAPPRTQARAPAFAGDYIVAVVNSESVTAGELEQRVERLRALLEQRGAPRPPTEAQLRHDALESLIDAIGNEIQSRAR